jgi:hypothetical protein
MPTQSSDSFVVTGIFADSTAAERAYRAAVERGYDEGDVNVVMSDDTRRRYFAEDRPVETSIAKKSAEGGELGDGPKGPHVGIAISIVAAVGAALIVPALGLVAAGPIAAALTGAGAAGLAATLIGALHDWGLPEERVSAYEAEIKNGGILIGVKAKSPDDARALARQWETLGARNLYA